MKSEKCAHFLSIIDRLSITIWKDLGTMPNSVSPAEMKINASVMTHFQGVQRAHSHRIIKHHFGYATRSSENLNFKLINHELR